MRDRCFDSADEELLPPFHQEKTQLKDVLICLLMFNRSRLMMVGLFLSIRALPVCRSSKERGQHLALTSLKLFRNQIADML